ncbi:hypothetical protein [Parasphingorhabdus halotolerans]|uniref:Uncharacterized protein n=1 Tax=Parasphingorhabdus halotolerans TaxID=2725558 RepID=A0A6H2DL10_9SPHN|nr:hypothetical protein [Parasphingorhabdus halotolerans]QJB69349.1 hypothetical protein HF685_08705 [Parasphingorhabdus halotolerans]
MIAMVPKSGRARADRAMRHECLQRLAAPLAEAQSVLSQEMLAQLLPLLKEAREKLDHLRD